MWITGINYVVGAEHYKQHRIKKKKRKPRHYNAKYMG